MSQARKVGVTTSVRDSTTMWVFYWLALRLAGSALAEREDLDVGEYLARLREMGGRLAEVEASLPDRAAFIRERCREDPDVLIELSLRSEDHLNPIPDLATAWTRSEVVLEFQCPNGVDYEVDALSQGVYRRADDKRDVSSHE